MYANILILFLYILPNLKFLSSGATVVSWRVNNQEQLFVRWGIFNKVCSYNVCIYSKKCLKVYFGRMKFIIILEHLSVIFSILCGFMQKIHHIFIPYTIKYLLECFLTLLRLFTPLTTRLAFLLTAADILELEVA